MEDRDPEGPPRIILYLLNRLSRRRVRKSTLLYVQGRMLNLSCTLGDRKPGQDTGKESIERKKREQRKATDRATFVVFCEGTVLVRVSTVV